MTFDAIGFQREGALATRLCLVELTVLPQRAREIVEDLHAVRRQRQPFAIAGDCLVEPSDIVQRGAEIVVELDYLRPEAQRSLEIRYRLLWLTELLERVAEIVERVDRSGGERQRALIAFDGLGRPIASKQNVAEIVVKRRVAPVTGDRFADMLDCIIRAALLMLDQPEQMQCWSVARVNRQN